MRLPDPAGEEADAVPHPGTFSQKGPRERKKDCEIKFFRPLIRLAQAAFFSQFNFAATKWKFLAQIARITDKGLA